MLLAPGRPRPRPVGRVGRGRLRRGRRRAHVRLAPARRRARRRLAVGVGVFPAVLTVTDGAWFAPAHQARSSSSSRRWPSAAEVGDYRVLYLGDPRLIPFPSDGPRRRRGDRRSSATAPTDLRDRWPVADQAADDAARATRSTQIAAGSTRCAAAGCWRRSASATSSCRSSTAPARRPAIRCRCPPGCSTPLGAQLDLVAVAQPARTSPASRTAPRSRPPPSLDGPLAEASTADGLTPSSASTRRRPRRR